MKKFYIFQSLKTTDPNLGEIIHNNLVKNNDSLFCKIKNKNELIESLDGIINELKKNSEIYPIIHFHTHGNNDGIALFNDKNVSEFINWNELRPFFTNINKAASKKSMISICACEGFNISRLVPRFEPCPFDYITGSFNPIGFSDSVNGYIEFYNGLINNLDLNENIKSICNKFPNMGFSCYNSDQIFQIAEYAYRNSEMVPERISERRKEFERIIIMEFGFINNEQKLFLDFALSEEGTNFYMEKFKDIFYQ